MSCVWGDSGRATHGVFIVDIDGQTKGTSVEWFTGSEAVHKRCLQVKQSNSLSSTTRWMQHIWTRKLWMAICHQCMWKLEIETNLCLWHDVRLIVDHRELRGIKQQYPGLKDRHTMHSVLSNSRHLKCSYTTKRAFLFANWATGLGIYNTHARSSFSSLHNKASVASHGDDGLWLTPRDRGRLPPATAPSFPRVLIIREPDIYTHTHTHIYIHTKNHTVV